MRERKPEIAREVAEEEINDWLDFKDVFEPSDEQKASIDVLIKSIMYGRLVYNKEEKTFVQKLKTPLNDSITELKYRARINDNHVQKYMKGVPQNDVDKRINAYIAALTETSNGIVGGLDYVDKRVANAITTFFF